jgi:MoaA/NifB/PqqE/SkfB family radical SAM enzyme
MLEALRQKVIIGASTRRAVAVPLGLVFGLWGALRGKRGSVDHLKSTASLASRSPVVAGRPMNITIEPTNACNLGCPVCETGAGILGRETGHMTLAEFQTIIDKVGQHTNTLMFYFMGEPFLNKQAYEMIRYAKDAGIPFIDTCTNGDFVDAERLVSSGLDRVSFQIGGMTQRTHEIYRVGGDLARVFERLKETVRVRNERQAPLQIEAGLILMKHN